VAKTTQNIEKRQDWLAIGVLLAISSLAFIRLLALPAFEDEGTELRWIWRAIEAGEWLQPLSDGKPLQVWAMVPFVKMGLHPLTVMRTLNVLVGMLGSTLVYRLSRQLQFNRITAFVAGALYAICPFVVYLERLALSETFFCVGGLWTLLNAVKFIEAPTLRHTALLASSLVLAAFCKFPVGFFFLLPLPLALMLLPVEDRSRLMQRSTIQKLAWAFAPVLLLAAAVVSIALIQLRFGKAPGFGMTLLIGIGMGRFQDPTTLLGIPKMSLLTELSAQLTWPVIAIGSIGVAASALLGAWRERWLILIGSIPLLGLGLFVEFWYPRYLLFALPPLILGAVLGWRIVYTKFKSSGPPLAISALGVCVLLLGRQSAFLISDPSAARWSELDRISYFEGWSSGYGYPEAAQFLTESRQAPPAIYSLDGHSAYQLRSYLTREWEPRIAPIQYGTNGEVLPTQSARIENVLKLAPVWIVASKQLLQRNLESSFGEQNLNRIELHPIAEFKKPGERAQLAIYELRRRN
jgi:4-amino-4-deoxy-L-arabinose transferase-like glycosyltransferase